MILYELTRGPLAMVRAPSHASHPYPRDRGFPEVEEAAAMGTPREQWEAAAQQRGS